MKYTAPSILNTHSAGIVIQTGTNILAKVQQLQLDSATPRMLSTTSAYDADE